MEPDPRVEPLSLRHRSVFFYLLLGLFFVSLPFLFLYATGYRFDFSGENTLIGTGGLYVAAERTGAEIYIDNELVRETRVFRRAFYAQSLPPGTHRVHVQKDGHHTWVKQLPVYAHLVTEAQAFNLPLVPQIRVVSPELRLDGSMHLTATSSVMLTASTTNAYTIATSTVRAANLVENSEYEQRLSLFEEVASAQPSGILSIQNEADEAATTTKESNGVRLFEAGGQVFAEFVGPREDMPYYYCAPDFSLISANRSVKLSDRQLAAIAASENSELLDPVAEVGNSEECLPIISIDNLEQEVSGFDFFPGSIDFALLALEDGIYMIEIDDRAWQNAQPVLLGQDLDMRVENGNVYVYDGKLIYEVQIDTQL